MKSICLIAVLAVAVTALSAVQPNVTISNCPGEVCAQTAQCQNWTIPSGACESGYTYTCLPSLNMCLDTEQYVAGTTTCPASDRLGPQTLQCGYCYALPNPQGQTEYGIAQFCHDNTKRTFEHKCDSNCQNCQASTPMPLNTCIPNPINAALGSYTFLRVRPCKKVVQFHAFANKNCTGAITQTSVMPADSCSWDTTNKSTTFFCDY